MVSLFGSVALKSANTEKLIYLTNMQEYCFPQFIL